MKAEIICFSNNGKKTALTVAECLKSSMDCRLWMKSKYAATDESFVSVTDPLSDWTASVWNSELIVFVGALGIAVRAIAGSVASKKTDPAVLVLDERMQYCIPLLSGHLGGANAFAEDLAGQTGSLPIITTATDINRLFAVDVFAKKNGLFIDNMTYAKEVSAALLAGQTVGLYTELPIKGEKLPKGLCLVRDKEEAKACPLGIYIGIYTDRAYFNKTLRLIPKICALGMGCRKGQLYEPVEQLVWEVVDRYKLDKRAFLCLASIDLKKDEACFKKLADALGIPFICYTAEELNAVKGEFTPSSFVKEITGVDNVCERSAMKAAASDRLLMKKLPMHGVTAALALKDRRIDFE